MEAALRSLAERLRSGPRITVLTGAGVSAASGVPTYRGAGGIWRERRAEQLATPEAFARDPVMIWEWYDFRRRQLRECRPNRAHEVLALWSHRYEGFRLVTQNVDGLHERAGTRGVLRFHGSIWEVGCWDGCAAAPHRWWDETTPWPEIPPLCPHCGGLLRPGVVWYGEAIDPQVLRAATAASDCEVFLAVGTSAVVHPAAGLIDAARRRGAFTVEVNPEPSAAAAELVLAGPAEEVLDRVEGLLQREGEGAAP